MSGLYQAKQINKFLSAFISVANFAPAGGTSDNITSALTTALSTASASGGSVPLQVGSATMEGVDTSAGFNNTPIQVYSTGKRLQDASGNDVYGQITNVTTTWTLSYFSNVAGTPTAFTMPATTPINFVCPYIFNFADYPMRAGTVVTEKFAAPDPASTAGASLRIQTDALTVTSVNTLSALSQTATGTLMMLIVNGQTLVAQDGTPAFTVSNKAVTWSAANAGFALATTDDVAAIYSY